MVHIYPHLLPKTDPRYIKWYESLKDRPAPWNKGLKKKDHQSLMKTSITFKKRGIDNFKNWRDERLEEHRRLINIPLAQSVEHAILVGIVLGDGNIYTFQRTESLTIVLGLTYPELVEYTARLVEVTFNKTPTISRIKGENAFRVKFYQQNISTRLGIISGKRRYDTIGIPEWIFTDKKYIIGCLKGLFEAEGSLSIHKPSSTYNFQFRNLNQTLLKQVSDVLIELGYHPEVRTTSVRLRRKAEVASFKDLIKFREYAG